MQKTLAFLFVLFLPVFVQAQQFHPPVVNFTPKHYGETQTAVNYSLIQDQRGVIYAGNSGGVLEYDGTNWNFIEVESGAYVTAMDIASNGILYVGTQTGEFGYLSPDASGKLKFISLRKKLNIPADDNQVNKIHCTSQGVYFQSRNHLFLYRNEKISDIKTSNSYHLSYKIGDQIYLRERNTGLVQVQGAQKKVLADIEEFSAYGIFGVHAYSTDSLMIFTQEKGFWRVHRINGGATCINSDSVELKQHQIIGSIALADGNYCLNTFLSGLLIVNKKGEIIHTINTKNGLSSNGVQHVIQDSHGNIWAALNSGIGLINYASSLHIYGEESGFEGVVYSVFKHGKDIYIGTSSGLFYEDYVSHEKVFKSVAEVRTQVWDVTGMNDRILAATDQGIHAGNHSGFRLVFSTKVNSVIYLADKNRILTTGPAGFFLLNENFKVLAEETSEIDMRTLVLERDPVDKNVVWLGTSGGRGIFKIDISNDQIASEKFANLEQKSLASVHPVKINNKLYFATKTGLRKLTFNKGQSFFDFAGVLKSLDNRPIDAIRQKGKRIWVCADNKMEYFDDLQNPVKVPLLPVDIGQINNLYAESDKSVWIAGAAGVVNYSEDYNRDYAQKFRVLIRNVKTKDSTLFFGNFVVHGKLSVKQGSEIPELKYSSNNIEFVYSAVYFEHPDRIVFSHMLEGQDEEWSQWSNETKVRFSNLHEGEYLFKVKARNVYGTESEIAVYKFVVHPPWYRTIFAYVLYALAAVLVFFVFNRISSNQLKKKNAHLESVVKKRTEEIQKKNEELNLRNLQILHQKQEITDSITYAKRIQEAMLPVKSDIAKNLPESFVLFKPKDIVSGDFYWFAEVDNKLIIICADCTGHGVPGAFTSMLSIDKLNQTILEQKMVMPHKILENVNRGIKKSLKQTETGETTRDGMDAAVCMIDRQTGKLYYAGANRPLWLVKNKEITEFTPTKCSVAGFTPEEQVFEQHEISLEKGQIFYMSTDGYADQFGGPKGKKIMVKNFKAILLEICHLTFKEQEAKLDWFVEDWKEYKDADGQTFEQIDDICVVGFRI